MFTSKLSPLGKENTVTLTKLAMPEKDSVHLRVINDTSHSRVINKEQSIQSKAIETYQKEKLFPAALSMTTKPTSSVAPNKSTFPLMKKSTPKVIQPLHVMQPKIKQ